MEGLAKAIGLAIRAGAFSAAARQFPEAAETFLAAAEVNRAKSRGALAQALAGRCSAPSIRTRGQ